MKESEYSMMSRGRTDGMPGSSTALLFGRDSSLSRPDRSHPSPREGFDLFMSLKYRGTTEGPMGLH
uniref:Uncharacterized protein n=1 Tax=Picea sitchensis TaxID=3332 RepID=D5A9U4_PICSI|nr:unknown [Picea sitchensis]